jgi:hypothetical protein
VTISIAEVIEECWSIVRNSEFQSEAMDKIDALAAQYEGHVVVEKDALKDAFFEGFTSVETYNDTRLNSAEEAWVKYEPALYRAKEPTK